LTEEDETAPQSVYGKSKLAGEKGLQEIWHKHYIIRTAWLYGQFGSNFIYTMIKLMNKLGSLKVVNDQHGSPTWAQDIAELIWTIIETDSNAYGTYHFSGEGECTWYDFAGEIYRLGKENGLIISDCTITPCSSGEFPTLAKRPSHSFLSKEKVKKIFPYIVPLWQDSLNDFMRALSDLNKTEEVSKWLKSMIPYL
jgi:dTDP-4-dehydrorhamnose reductase